MGGAVSTGADNDELIDNLLEADYIKTSLVERVFRAVDRGHYFTPECKESAYKDLAWKCGNLHISAPCIYSEVMESLKLEPSLSFLNLGSGTGYLSTMVGLILGKYGVNHGIEIHKDVLEYANKRLEEFCRTSHAIDEYEFCPPKFINGNCLFLESEVRQYDRVYCGAACPEKYENYMKHLIKVGGILVMPINDHLLQICRTSEDNWETKSVLPVSFATLMPETFKGSPETIKMPETDPLSLQDICRYTVRSILRRIIDVEHPELKSRPVRAPRKKIKKRALRQLVIPIFSSHSDYEENDDPEEHHTGRDFGRGGFLMDINDDSCAIIELSQFLQGPSRSNTNTESENRMSEESEHKESSPSTSKAQDNVNNDISDDEVMSDLEVGSPKSSCKEEEEEKKEDTCMEYDDKTANPDCKNEETDKKIEGECSLSVVAENKSKSRPKREKFDSGIVEDIENGKISSDSDLDVDMDLNSDSDFFDATANEDEKIHKAKVTRRHPFLRVVDSDTDAENADLSDEVEPNQEKCKESQETSNVPVINYTVYMKEKINELPLPLTLKYFLNLDRSL